MSSSDRSASQRPSRNEDALSLISFFSVFFSFCYYFEHIVPPSSYDSGTSCLGASLSSGNVGLHGYSECKRGGGGSWWWEGGKKDGVFRVCEAVGDAPDTFPCLVCRRLIGLLPPLPSLSSGGGGRSSVGMLVVVCTLVAGLPRYMETPTRVHGHMLGRSLFPGTVSRSGRIPPTRHHGNPASGEGNLYLVSESVNI